MRSQQFSCWALGRDYGQPIWKKLDDGEVAEISQTMAQLGNIRPELIEYIFSNFISQMSISGSIHGNYETTERLLSEYLPEDRLTLIMEEIRGPAGRNMWEKLSNVSIPVLTNYLKNEYPQTVAVILSRIATNHAAGVLGILPDDPRHRSCSAHVGHGTCATRNSWQNRGHAAL